ncbi:hypothetical protein BA916_05315 [Helicobacter pullorum]|nr:hypothetical protein BA916_05315 [Helicobacter pullorum]
MKKINKLYNNTLNFIDINKIKYQELKSINLNQPNLPNPLKSYAFILLIHTNYILQNHIKGSKKDTSNKIF